MNNIVYSGTSLQRPCGVKSFDPCREFGCFQSLFFIVVDHCGPFTLAVVKSQVVLGSPFVERFHCSYSTIKMGCLNNTLLGIYQEAHSGHPTLSRPYNFYTIHTIASEHNNDFYPLVSLFQISFSND